MDKQSNAHKLTQTHSLHSVFIVIYCLRVRICNVRKWILILNRTRKKNLFYIWFYLIYLILSLQAHKTVSIRVFLYFCICRSPHNFVLQSRVCTFYFTNFSIDIGINESVRYFGICKNRATLVLLIGKNVHHLFIFLSWQLQFGNQQAHKDFKLVKKIVLFFYTSTTSSLRT